MRRRDKFKKHMREIGEKMGIRDKTKIATDTLETGLKILKESSDFNPALKAVVGGVCEVIRLLHVGVSKFYLCICSLTFKIILKANFQ
jgi:hypothetical protein